MTTITKRRPVDLIFPGSPTPKRGMKAVDLRSLGAMLAVQGAAGRGTNAHGDIVYATADAIPVNDLWAEFQQAIGLLNAERQAIVDFLTYGVGAPYENVIQGSTTVDFELASEFGEPVGVRPVGPVTFSLGYGFEWYDIAARFTWRYLADAPAAQVQATNNMILEADNRLVFNGVMKTVFNPTNLASTIEGRPYTVYKFYNADGTVPPAYKSYTHAGTHNHFLVSGAAAIDAGDIDDIELHLTHHGYSVASGVRLVLMLNKQEADVVRNFRSVVNGGTAKYDFIPARNSVPYMLPINPTTGNVLTLPPGSAQPAPTLAGLDVVGSYGPFLVVNEDYIPPGYVFSFATGGRANLTNPVGFREHANPALRGLQLVKGRTPDYPLLDSFYTRGFGTGVRQRGAGVVMQIKTTGAYVPPALYV